MLKGPQHRGFTLIELMVGLSIVGIVIALGTPSFAIYLQSSKLAHSGQSYLSGVQLARTEAIRHNLPVEFVLTNTPVDLNVALNAVPSPTGQNWVVRWFDAASAPGAYKLIEAKPALEGSFSSTGVPAVQITGSAVPPGFNGVVAFNGLGATRTGAAYQLDLTNPSGGACAPTGPMRCPRIRVSAGGLSTVCDPLIVASTDSRFCP